MPVWFKLPTGSKKGSSPGKNFALAERQGTARTASGGGPAGQLPGRHTVRSADTSQD